MSVCPPIPHYRAFVIWGDCLLIRNARKTIMDSKSLKEETGNFCKQTLWDLQGESHHPWVRKDKAESWTKKGDLCNNGSIFHLTLKQRINIKNLQGAITVLLMGECNEGENWVLKTDRKKKKVLGRELPLLRKRIVDSVGEGVLLWCEEDLALDLRNGRIQRRPSTRKKCPVTLVTTPKSEWCY